jgi:hypothetical protein
VSLFAEQNELQFAVPGGLIGKEYHALRLENKHGCFLGFFLN